ncbi:SusC/RagA family TonB-linked outer membrane protein [Dysgonomonas macrotermitis]|uniref:TonB-linked outer membrane protein, SusC/RagA family n=1 Tax=Dysgonomonas macrotermitis TaxID=1346286 RepID=A0A1M4XB63_9BACT|nr:SusC/RagA family TonB-linked outer membrane protein [Dysgonomonas macrotermitis]SHE90640.1 TonB-linked outer membrane protein, SusC/RagA family [Dysgonomonas macrotermitis]
MNRKNSIIYLLSFLFLMTGMAVHAQESVLIRGKVISATDKEPIIGCSVVEMDKDNRIVLGTQTDLDGNFSMRITPNPGHKLVFTTIGFKSKNIALSAASREVNCSLEEDAKGLTEVVVTAKKKANAGPFAIAERDMTYAYSKIDASEIEDLPVASIDEALQGRMAGVDITATSGEPGAGMSIRIRGTSSINSSSNPLIVVDNIPYDVTISSDFDFATADEESYSQLLNISPSDIAEISVLKDAAATALYGSQGANGVLLIKTKRGTYGPPRISYSFKGMMTELGSPIKTLNGDEYVTMIQEAFQNSGTPIDLSSYPQFARDPNNPYYYYNYGQDTDWVDAITQTGWTQDHNLSISGGGTKALYRMSLGYYNSSGNVIGQSLDRITTNFNLNYNISERMRVSADVSYTHSKNNKNFMTDLLESTYTKMPNQSIYEYTDTGINTGKYFSPSETPQGSFTSADLDKYKKGIYNPVAMAEEGTWDVVTDRVRPKFSLQYQIVPEQLILDADLAFDISSEKNKKFLPQIATGRPWYEATSNRAEDSDLEAFIVRSYTRLSYNPKLNNDKHSLFVGGQFSTYDKQVEGWGLVSANTASTEVQDPSLQSRIISTASSRTQERTMSALLTAQYSFLDRYIINGVIRMDGDSKYSENHRYGYFPSLSGRWRVSSEPFMKKFEFIDDLSYRISYGESGRALDKNYLAYKKYGSYGYTYLGMQGIYVSSMELEDLRWEKTSEINTGFNLIAFDNRIDIDFNWYKRTTNDLYFDNAAIANTSGFDKISMNVGTIENKGWELSVFTTPYRSKDWNVNFRMTLAHNDNIITKLSDNISTSTTPTAENGKFMTRIQEGNPVGSFYGYKYAGVYLNDSETIAKDKNGNAIYTYENGQKVPVKMKFWYPTVGYEFEAGDAKYVDINNDGNINEQDIVYLGNANPKLTGGFGPSVKFKNWSLDAYFNFRYGCDIINSTKMSMESMYNFDNQSKATLRRWRAAYENAADAPSDLLPRALYRKGYNWLGSDRYVEDGSFLRFQSLTLKYTFDRNVIQKLGVSAMNIYCTLYNLYVWTNYSGLDPEVSSRSSDLNKIGYDESKAPRPKTAAIGINLTF